MQVGEHKGRVYFQLFVILRCDDAQTEQISFSWNHLCKGFGAEDKKVTKMVKYVIQILNLYCH